MCRGFPRVRANVKLRRGASRRRRSHRTPGTPAATRSPRATRGMSVLALWDHHRRCRDRRGRTFASRTHASVRLGRATSPRAVCLSGARAHRISAGGFVDDRTRHRASGSMYASRHHSSSLTKLGCESHRQSSWQRPSKVERMRFVRARTKCAWKLLGERSSPVNPPRFEWMAIRRSRCNSSARAWAFNARASWTGQADACRGGRSRPSFDQRTPASSEDCRLRARTWRAAERSVGWRLVIKAS